MEKKTIEQLAVMPGAELRKYILSLSVEEYKLIDKELYKARVGATVKQMVDNLNSNVKADKSNT